MANENEELEIKKKPQQVDSEDLKKVAGGDCSQTTISTWKCPMLSSFC